MVSGHDWIRRTRFFDNSTELHQKLTWIKRKILFYSWAWILSFRWLLSQVCYFLKFTIFFALLLRKVPVRPQIFKCVWVNDNFFGANKNTGTFILGATKNIGTFLLGAVILSCFTQSTPSIKCTFGILIKNSWKMQLFIRKRESLNQKFKNWPGTPQTRWE